MTLSSAMPSNSTHAPALRGAHMERAVFFVVRVHPDEPVSGTPARFEDLDLGHRRGASRGVRGDRQAGRFQRDGRGLHELCIHVRQRCLVDTDLHERGTDVGAVDAVLGLPDPSSRELIGALRERVLGKELVVRSAVVAGVGQDVHA